MRFGIVISIIMTYSVMHTVDGCLYAECVCMCVHVCCCLVYTGTGVLRLSSTSTTEWCSAKASVCTLQEFALRKRTRGATCPGRRKFLSFFLYVFSNLPVSEVYQIQNEQFTTVSQDQSQKPQEE